LPKIAKNHLNEHLKMTKGMTFASGNSENNKSMEIQINTQYSKNLHHKSMGKKVNINFINLILLFF